MRFIFSRLMYAFLVFVFSSFVHAKDNGNLGLIDPDIYLNVGDEAARPYAIVENNNGVYSIKLGRFDTPCPPKTEENPDCEQPEVEIDTFYSVRVYADTKGGGVFSFKYKFKTYDSGQSGKDSVDISFYRPDYPDSDYIALEDNWKSPYEENGALWDSGERTFSFDLDPWKYDQYESADVWFWFSTDSYGDQSLLEIYDIKVVGCDVIPLTPITDPEAIEFENGNNINTEKLNAATKQGLSCMENRVPKLGGIFTLTSAYRPVSYQEHLYDIWMRDKDLKNSAQPKEYCSSLQNEVNQEMSKHGLVAAPAYPNPAAPHPSGNAIDATITGLPAPHTVDTVAKECGMWRRMPTADPVHYEPRPTFFKHIWETLFYD